MTKLLLLITVLFITGCNELTGGSTGASKLLNDFELVGTNGLLHKETLGSVGDDTGVDLVFSLPEDGSNLTLHVFCQKNLKQGINIIFTRLSGKVLIYVTHDDLGGSVLKEFTPDGFSHLSFSVDVHNGESPTHVLVWPSSVTPKDGVSAFMNSEKFPFPLDEGGFNFPEWELNNIKGKNIYWGLTLSGAKLQAANLTPVYFRH